MNQILDPHSDDHIILLCEAVARQRREQLDLRTEVEGVKQDQLKLAGALEAVRKANSNGNFTFCIPWLEYIGVSVPTNYFGTVGLEFQEIAEELGFPPRPKEPFRGVPSRPYTKEAATKTGQLWYERNRRKPSRHGWFRNGC